MNPQHTIPTLVDGDFVIWDSHAIVPYLVSKYAKDDSLYPKDLQKRATIDNRLHLNNTVTLKAFGQVAVRLLQNLFIQHLRILDHFQRALIFDGKKSIPEEALKDVENALTLLNTLLEHSKFAAGDAVSVADFCWISTITTLNVCMPINGERWPHLVAWVERMKQLPCYAANVPGLRQFEMLAKSKINQ